MVSQVSLRLSPVSVSPVVTNDTTTPLYDRIVEVFELANGLVELVFPNHPTNPNHSRILNGEQAASTLDTLLNLGYRIEYPCLV